MSKTIYERVDDLENKIAELLGPDIEDDENSDDDSDNSSDS